MHRCVIMISEARRRKTRLQEMSLIEDSFFISFFARSVLLYKLYLQIDFAVAESPTYIYAYNKNC